MSTEKCNLVIIMGMDERYGASCQELTTGGEFGY
jgi:hypothetical protein